MAKIPKFKSDKEAGHFWDTHSLTDYEEDLQPVDMVFVKPDRQVVSLRLDRKVVKSLKAYGAKMGLGCSSLLWMWILEKYHQTTHPRSKSA